MFTTSSLSYNIVVHLYIVTVVGMSAGGASVHYLLLSPNSAGLFHRAVSFSGQLYLYTCSWLPITRESPSFATLIFLSPFSCFTFAFSRISVASYPIYSTPFLYVPVSFQIFSIFFHCYYVLPSYLFSLTFFFFLTPTLSLSLFPWH